MRGRGASRPAAAAEAPGRRKPAGIPRDGRSLGNREPGASGAGRRLAARRPPRGRPRAPAVPPRAPREGTRRVAPPGRRDPAPRRARGRSVRAFSSGLERAPGAPRRTARKRRADGGTPLACRAAPPGRLRGGCRARFGERHRGGAGSRRRQAPRSARATGRPSLPGRKAAADRRRAVEAPPRRRCVPPGRDRTPTPSRRRTKTAPDPPAPWPRSPHGRTAWMSLRPSGSRRFPRSRPWRRAGPRGAGEMPRVACARAPPCGAAAGPRRHAPSPRAVRLSEGGLPPLRMRLPRRRMQAVPGAPAPARPRGVPRFAAIAARTPTARRNGPSCRRRGPAPAPNPRDRAPLPAPTRGPRTTSSAPRRFQSRTATHTLPEEEVVRA